jgi:hypothetical protein
VRREFKRKEIGEWNIKGNFLAGRPENPPWPPFFKKGGTRSCIFDIIRKAFYFG